MKQTQNSVCLEISNKGEFFLLLNPSEVLLPAAGRLGTRVAQARSALCPPLPAAYPLRPRPVCGARACALRSTDAALRPAGHQGARRQAGATGLAAASALEPRGLGPESANHREENTSKVPRENKWASGLRGWDG